MTMDRIRRVLHRPLILGLAAGAVLLLCPPPVRAQGPLHVAITNVPYRDVFAFLFLHVEALGTQEFTNRNASVAQKDSYLGFGLGMFSAANTGFQLGWKGTYQRYKADRFGLAKPDGTLHCLDLHVGGRYFPKYPTFGFGKWESGLAFRLTFSAMAGVSLFLPANSDINKLWSLSTDLTAGLAISTGNHPSGLMIECVYRPLSRTLNFQSASIGPFVTVLMKPALAFRLTYLFGP